MDRIACSQCKQCNRKGKPSVSRYSKYCNTNHINKKIIKQGILTSIFTKIKNKYYDARVKYNEQGQIKKMNTKGFRTDWFYR